MAHQPLLGGAQSAAFDPQFPGESVDVASLAVTPIEHLANDGSGLILSHGTGFFWRHGNRAVLITARHVLSGADPFTDALMSPNGFIPERVRVYPTIEYPGGASRAGPVEVSVRVDDQPQWAQDPFFAELKTDIAAIAVPVALSDGQRVVCLNDPPDILESIMTHVGFECSIAGYPNANLGGLRTPIWRKGVLASEPFLAIDGKPMFLIDASTSPGFSGAPVLRRHVGPAPIRQSDGSITVMVDRVLSTSFIGVYAGRLQNSYYGGEIPFAFYGNRVPIIANLVP